ncbi:hypothetical protein GC722_12115 [Auraticoccus sp. F435]|uniref:Tetratricopeptide repeat protein n=1 Tax=Auraticoccus cholistanensis TaxID=2656650 RepID=A0A6A9UY87_9ACTN|nr:hypothetical protein [Auraticoccus cholistanensis]MVA76762.1 hypothetical protein [Auraticoccus cholistanensis]
MTAATLPAEIASRWRELATEAGARQRAGDPAGALALTEQAWQVLPEPHAQWGESSMTAQGGIQFARAADDIDQAWTWLNRAKEVYTSESGTFLVACWEGELRWHFRTEDAVPYLRDLLRVYGTRAFRTLPEEALAAARSDSRA